MDKVQEEFSDYIECGFEPVKTADGSFTLMQEGLGEEMHSRAGALSESSYIYYSPLRSFMLDQEPDSCCVISVGLGLGYNELLTAHIATSLQLENMSLVSFEKEEVLRDLFFKRVAEPESYPLYFEGFFKNFKDFNLNLISRFLNEKSSFKGEFSKDVIASFQAGSKAVLFDAYSNKTSTELWDVDFLQSFLQKCTEPSLLSTYACTGDLNRALKSSGFIRDKKRKGFAMKREATLAFKV